MTWSFFREQKNKRSKSRRHDAAGRRRPRFEPLETRDMLAVLTVNSLLDNTTGGDGLVTLREAIIASNTDAATDLAETGSGADIIQFTGGLSGTITLAGALELVISDSVTIDGPGAASITIDAVGASRIFNISEQAGDVTLNGLTLTGGNAPGLEGGGAVSSVAFGLLTISDSVITGSTAQFGGGIYSYHDLTLLNTTVGGPGALANTATAGGGGIFVYDNLSTTTLRNSTVSGNTAGGGFNGGGIYSPGALILENSTIGGSAAGAGNSASGDGGGIYARTVSLLNSTVSGNTAGGRGGGIYALSDVSLTNSTLSANTAATYGGGIFTSTAFTATNSTIGGTSVAAGNKSTNGGGAGISATDVLLDHSTVAFNDADGNNSDGGGVNATRVTLRHSTIWGNTADDNGGGIYADNVTVDNSTIASNTADANAGGMGDGGGVYAVTRFRMNNSIVIGNSDTGGANADLRIPAGMASLVRFSLIGDNTGLPAGAQFTVTGPAGAANTSGNRIGQPGGANAIGIALVLDPAGLQDNGGPTTTVALLAGSLAIDAGKNSLATNPASGDQRGLPFVRIFGGNVDMGAFEFQTVALNNPPVVATPIPDQSAVVGVPFVFTFAADAFTDADGDPLTYTAALSGGGALPAWLTFTQGTNGRTFVGIPTAADIGSYTIRVTASDGKGGTVSDEFVLNVTTNPPPVVSNPIPDQLAFVATPFNFVVPANTFTDPNGDTLTYSATLSGGGALPAWLTFNPATQTFSGTPGAGDVGAISVRVNANDGQGNIVFDDFNITVSASELPFNETFEAVVDPRISQKGGTFTTTMTNPVNGTTSFLGTRNTVGERPLATVDFANPATAAMVTNVKVNVSTLTGNGSSLWSNALVTFDYQSPNNYKFAGVFEIIDKLIIGQVVNGRVTYLAQRNFTAASNTPIPLDVTINRMTRQVTLTSGATTFSHTYAALGNGTVGVGTINANARFDNLMIT
jgi:predicted outer membrane repeat protein